jgi:molecular chaperone HtpG
METMQPKKGSINVQTENIFPIIKKFLYSDHEIFLRELVSNAVDAAQKLKTLASAGEFKGELGDLKVTVSTDKDAGTITISDNGVGMTGEEVEKYLNQVAFSGAKEFLEKYKGVSDGNTIIGHFGLGFYSSFMVSSEVEVITRSWKEGSEAVKWTCDGSPEYTLEPAERTERGTDIVLHIAEDSKEFLEPARIRGILEKYGKFLPVEVYFEDKKINTTQPAWTKKPVDLNEEDYKTFYKELYPYSYQEPLFHIHLNVDYPFNLTGILYFPKLGNQFEPQRNKIQLYSNQVFITDAVEGIVPDFLTLLHGVIDSPDIPLNVSRSYLQSDGNVKKISSHITKKVSDKLAEMFKNNREDFEQKWEDIRVFIQYGIITDDKFSERASAFTLYKNTEGKHFTFEEYKEHIQAVQTDKDNHLVVLYTNDPEHHHSYLAICKERGYDVLVMNSPLDAHFIQKIESADSSIRFARIDSDSIEKLIDKGIETISKLTEDQKNELQPVFESQVNNPQYTVTFENLSETDPPVMVTQAEFMRRMTEMNALGGGAMGKGLPEFHSLVINTNHPLVSKLLHEADKEKQGHMAKQAIDLALLSRGLLKGEALTQFIRRSTEQIG